MIEKKTTRIQTVVKKSRNSVFKPGDEVVKFRKGDNNCDYYTRISDGAQQRIHKSYLQ